MLKLHISLIFPFIFLISSIKSEFTMMQISDFHLDVDYSRQGDPSKLCHIGNEANARHPKNIAIDKKLGFFGDYMCDSPVSLVENAVQSAAKLFPNPNLILWTGDNVPHIEDYNLNYSINALNVTTQQLKKYYPDAIILPTYGNHDHAPANQFGEQDQLFYSKTFEMWRNWVGDENKETFLKGAYYKRQFGKTKFLVLNTNYYYQFNQAKFVDPRDPADQFKFMLKELEESRKNGEAVNIVAHIAPGMYERKANFSWFRDVHNERFLKIVNNYTDIIKLMIFGHHHTDTFHVVRNDAGVPTQICYMCPAVTPWYSDLGDGANNPAFRRYLFDKEGDWTLKDIETYYVNLTELNSGVGKADWKLEYSFKKAYGLKDFTAKSFESLVDRFEKDDKLYQSYLDFNTVSWSPPSSHAQPSQKDLSDQKVGQICSLRHADYVAYRKCIKDGNKDGDNDGNNNGDKDATSSGELRQGVFPLILLSLYFAIFKMN